MNTIDFNEKTGFICDMDGVIYHGNQILPGVTEFIQWLQASELPLRRRRYGRRSDGHGCDIRTGERHVDGACAVRCFYGRDH